MLDSPETRVFHNFQQIHEDGNFPSFSGDIEPVHLADDEFYKLLDQAKKESSKQELSSRQDLNEPPKFPFKRNLSNQEAKNIVLSGLTKMAKADKSQFISALQKTIKTQLNLRNSNSKMLGKSLAKQKTLLIKEEEWSVEKACCDKLDPKLTEQIKERYNYLLERSQMGYENNAKWDKEGGFGDR